MSSEIIKGKTKTGFEYTIERKRLNNYELVEMLTELDDNPLLLPKILKLLLGKQNEALKDHVRDEEGLVDLERMNEEIVDIFKNQTLKK